MQAQSVGNVERTAMLSILRKRIDSNTEYRDHLNRPRRLVEHGGVMPGLF